MSGPGGEDDAPPAKYQRQTRGARARTRLQGRPVKGVGTGGKSAPNGDARPVTGRFQEGNGRRASNGVRNERVSRERSIYNTEGGARRRTRQEGGSPRSNQNT